MRVFAQRLVAVLVGLLGLASAGASAHSLDPSPQAPDFAQRATIVRERLEEIERRQPDLATSDNPSSRKQAQWLNFPNWPNWNNWANYWNNWGNFYR